MLIIPSAVETSSVNVLDFFAKLQEAESKKEKVGTVHARRKDPYPYSSKETSGNKGDWNCPKCETTNFKHSIQCTRCHAMKRITEYR